VIANIFNVNRLTNPAAKIKQRILDGLPHSRSR
jgi:hypothetical protein